MRYGYDDYDDYELNQIKALNNLKPEYRKWVDEVTRSEDYCSGMDMEDALKQAYDMQQADEYDAEQAWIEKMEEEDNRKSIKDGNIIIYTKEYELEQYKKIAAKKQTVGDDHKLVYLWNKDEFIDKDLIRRYFEQIEKRGYICSYDLFDFNGKFGVNAEIF